MPRNAGRRRSRVPDRAGKKTPYRMLSADGCPDVLFGEVTWTCCRRLTDLPGRANSEIPACGNVEPRYQRHCWWLRHYLSAPRRVVINLSVRLASLIATCILNVGIVNVGIVLLSDLLSALTQLATPAPLTKQDL